MISIKEVEDLGEEAIARAKHVREIGPNMVAALAKRLVREHEAIDARLAALEQRRTLAFAGPFDVTRGYRQDDLVQRGAALWLALTETKMGDMPGASPSWRRIAESRA